MVSDQAEAEWIFQQGRAAWLQNDLNHAVSALRRAVELAPENGAYQYALGSALLKCGDLPNGYPLLNRWRSSLTGSKATPRLPIPTWSGQSASGRHFLIWGEDGFGDQIMYLRYACDLLRRGALASWICPPPLKRVIASTGVNALPNDEAFEITGTDFYLPSSSLPEAFGTSLSSISGEPFIPRPPPVDCGARIGVIASASPIHADGPARSLPPTEACRLLSAAGVINLDPAITGARDFYDTAAIIAGLECVVTVDTAVAHLAGGMGVRTLVLLPYVADWKWFTDPAKTPWYDSVTLIRQPKPDDWHSTVNYALDLTR